MRQVTLLSGKGGTGKTSLTAAFASVAPRPVLADCDVDGSDLHLVLDPVVEYRTIFVAGHDAHIDPDVCTGCGRCEQICRFDAIQVSADGSREVVARRCEGCGACVIGCPAHAVVLAPSTCGEWYLATTRLGPLAYARLTPGAENSGRLATVVREAAIQLATDSDAGVVLVDGPPGIGCPVHAAMTGADAVLLVCEASRSGWHDAQRVIDLARQFRVPVYACINRWDLAPDITRTIEREARAQEVRCLGHVRYDPSVTEAHAGRKTLLEYGCPAATDARAIWQRLWEHIQ